MLNSTQNKTLINNTKRPVTNHDDKIKYYY